MARHERTLYKSDLHGHTTLYDRVDESEVEIVELCTGCVYLRYPDQSKRHFWECDCDAVVMGYDELKRHAQKCDQANEEWFEGFGDPTTGNDWFEEFERPNCHIESCSYQYPLDGHRFTIRD